MQRTASSALRLELPRLMDRNCIDNHASTLISEIRDSKNEGAPLLNSAHGPSNKSREKNQTQFSNNRIGHCRRLLLKPVVALETFRASVCGFSFSGLCVSGVPGVRNITSTNINVPMR